MDAMDAKTAVSIIIPFYNGIDWLEMIFVALGKQTFKDFEVIVADDGSREDVVARLEELMAVHRAIYGPARTDVAVPLAPGEVPPPSLFL